jgi:hypothetical protein
MSSNSVRSVITGLDPVIHALIGKLVDGRIKSGHDEDG